MQYYPQSTPMMPQFAPQGWVGDMISHQAPLIGGAVGGLTTELSGHASLGGLVGGATTMLARDYGHLLPFQAGPGMAAPAPAPAAYAPQGFWGNVISGVGNVAGHIVGGDTGRTISNVSGFAQYLPFQAGPGAAPQVVAAPQAYAPQAYAPQPYAPQAYAPQGFWGNMIADVAPVIGRHVGGNGGRVISTVGGLADMLPFQAGPGAAPQVVAAPQAYAPQGFWGNMIADVAPVIGRHVGGNGGRVISTVGGLADMLPFQAGPMTAPQQAYAPQGFWGNVISGVGNVAGQIVGGDTGRTISNVSGFAQYLPFQAGPGAAPQVVAAPQAYAPQGIFGSIGGGLLGGAIGNAFGNKGLGSAIGGIVGGFLPFQAGPGQPVQYIPVNNDQVVYH